jgi:alkaline phosphatase D
MKVAFTSCIDAYDDPSQPVWDKIRQQEPDVLLLLGDLMYMDYGLALTGAERPLGWPRKVSDAVFAQTMHERYARQWGVKSFRELLCTGVRLGVIWDDHDFAWNDARGQGTELHHAVSTEKRLIAQGLFRQFRDVCAMPDVSVYPPMPSLASLLGTEEKGIEDYFDVDEVRFVMLDGRSYRQDPNTGPDADMHGYTQRKWLGGLLAGEQALTVLCSGSVLHGATESWDKYLDYQWLLGEAKDKVIVLSGDIHCNKLPVRHSAHVIEVTSSGGARPGSGGVLSHLGGASGNFGLLEIGNSLSVKLFSQMQPGGVRADIIFGQPVAADEM